MKNKVIFYAIALAMTAGASYADDPRFSRVIEYQLIDLCVGNEPGEYERKVKICACALHEAQEDGWFPDYDNDDDYKENRKEFWASYKKAIRKYTKNRSLCKFRF